MEEVDYKTSHPVLTITQKFSKFDKVAILSNLVFSLSKKQMHIFNMSATNVQSLSLIAKKLWEELIIQTF